MASSSPSKPALLQQIVQDGVTLRIGSFSFGVRIQDAQTAREMLALYDGYPFEMGPVLSDFHIQLKPLNPLRTWLHPRVRAYIDHQAVFKPAPPHLGVPLLESVINSCIGTRTTRYLMLHAAVVERDGGAVVMPGASGAGKSTLTTALITSGWRLLSDEVTIIGSRDGLLRPHPRPISLKNEAIDLITNRYPELVATRRYEGTTKGTVVFLRAPLDAIQNADSCAKPFLVIAPNYDPEGKLNYDRLEKAQAFMLLVRQSPNYKILLDRGFETLANFVEACEHYTLTYSDLDKAVDTIDALSRGSVGGTQAA